MASGSTAAIRVSTPRAMVALGEERVTRVRVRGVWEKLLRRWGRSSIWGAGGERGRRRAGEGERRGGGKGRRKRKGKRKRKRKRWIAGGLEERSLGVASVPACSERAKPSRARRPRRARALRALRAAPGGCARCGASLRSFAPSCARRW